MAGEVTYCSFMVEATEITFRADPPLLPYHGPTSPSFPPATATIMPISAIFVATLAQIPCGHPDGAPMLILMMSQPSFWALTSAATIWSSAVEPEHPNVL